MCANIKVRFVGSDPDDFTVNQVYQVLSLGGTSFTVLDDVNAFRVASIGADWQLVSIIVPGDSVQLYP